LANWRLIDLGEVEKECGLLAERGEGTEGEEGVLVARLSRMRRDQV